MNDRRAKMIEKLFQEAADLPKDQQEQFLRRRCQGDPELRSTVEDLLQHHADAAPEFLRGRLDQDFEPDDAEPANALAAGRRVGRYRIIRLIAMGGMGCVYEAEQAEPKRRVALKMLRGGLAAPDALRRFAQEAQILAQLQHACIAQVYEAEMHAEDSGAVPYFALEYVDGAPITEYADQRRLSTNRRLELFVQVCDAVHHGHQRGVIHRDLKPGNILVNAEGDPKLLDFGIAKLLDHDAAGASASMTVTGMQVMTPAYASPEQVRGEAVTTATDVYSLGVVLYEMLSGRRPYRVENFTPQAVERIICDVDPARPSEVIGRAGKTPSPGASGMPKSSPESVSSLRNAAPRALRRRLAGDLDNIVLMALRKEPQRRYKSVHELAEDIRRYLRGLPVTARTDSPLYRGSRFVRRNKAGVVAAALVAASLLGGIVAAARQARIAARERDVAVSEQVKAESITGFLQKTLSAFDPEKTRGEEVTVRAVLDQAGKRLETELHDQPEAQASVRDTLGWTYRNLGFFTDAESHLRLAYETRRDVLGEEHPQTLQSMNSLALTLQDLGRLSDAEPLYRKGLAIRRCLLGEDNPDTVLSLNNLGWLLWSQGETAEAEAALRECLSLRRRVSGDEDRETFRTEATLAAVLCDLGRRREAEPLSRHAVTAAERTLGAEDSVTRYAMRIHVWNLKEMGRLDEAEALGHRVLELDRRILGEDHPFTCYSMQFLAGVLVDRGRLADAEPLCHKSLEVRRKLLGDDHPATLNSMNNLGDLYLNRDMTVDAAPLLESAYDGNLRVLGPEHSDTLAAMQSVALLRQAQQQCSEAESLFRRALEIRQRVHGSLRRDTLICMLQLGELLNAERRPLDAEPLLREALDLAPHVLPDGDWLAPALRAEYGRCVLALQRYAEAEAHLLDSHGELESLLDAEHEITREARDSLAELYEVWGTPTESTLRRSTLPATSASRPDGD